MKRILLFTLIALLSFVAIRALEQQGAAADTRPRTPVTIVEAEILDTDVESHRIVAIRSDGAKAVQALKTGKSNTGTEARSITLPAEGKEVVIADAVKALSTLYFPVSNELVEGARTVAVNSHCAEEPAGERRLLGEETVLGYRTYKYESNESVQGIVQNETIWLAPVLDCYPIRYINRRTSATGDVQSIFERKALSVTLGEPDVNLFTIPSGYREVPPSQASQELRSFRTGQQFGVNALDKKLLPGMSRMDHRYFESQKHRP